jgi:dienelactone hydrolase
MRAVLVLLFGFLGPIISPAMAEQPLVVEERFLTVTIGGQDYRLEALIAKEAGSSERLPVALITHGQAVEAEKREQIEARGFLPLAREFARRGWLAVVVVRRGFGHSEGPTPYVLKQCRNGDYAASLAAQTDDIEAAMKAVGRRNDADISTVLAFGISVGGATVLDLAARQPEGLKAVVNIAGGIKTFAKPGGPPASCKPEDLIPLFGRLGERSRLPTLWLYAENDSYFAPDYVRSLHEAYIARGGRAEFHMFEPIGQDGHSIALSFDGMLRWLPALDVSCATTNSAPTTRRRLRQHSAHSICQTEPTRWPTAMTGVQRKRHSRFPSPTGRHMRSLADATCRRWKRKRARSARSALKSLAASFYAISRLCRTVIEPRGARHPGGRTPGVPPSPTTTKGAQ